MTNLFIMCGYPFSGKSTIATRLVTERSVRRVSVDQINEELEIGGNPELPITAAEWDRTYALFFVRVGELLNASISVVADTAGYSFSERQQLRDIGTLAGASVVVIHVKVSEEVARERLAHNRQTPTRHDVRDSDFENVIANFEAPGPLEFTIVYDHSTAWEEFLRESIDPLG
jgi:predicted kinase